MPGRPSDFAKGAELESRAGRQPALPHDKGKLS